MRTGRDRADIVAVSLIRYLALALAAGVAVLPIEAEAKPLPIKTSPGGVIESLTLHLELAGMKMAKAPEAIARAISCFRVSGPYRSVAAAFAHEGFANLHSV